MPAIYVDADACPVKDEVVRVATRHKLKVLMVGNSWMRLSDDPLVERVAVPNTPDAADDWIAERAGAGDVVITSDIPLAGRVVTRGALVVRPNGKPLNSTSIGMAVATRDLHTHLREVGQITSGPAAYTKQDRSRFLDVLETTVRSAMKVAPTT